MSVLQTEASLGFGDRMALEVAKMQGFFSPCETIIRSIKGWREPGRVGTLGADLLIRGLILLIVIAVALFAALRAFTKSGQSPAAACGSGQACVTTNDALPGGWPSNPNQP
jgi:hypothetical protein